MSGWLPPGCTDKDIDDAAPQNEPEQELPWCDGCRHEFAEPPRKHNIDRLKSGKVVYTCDTCIERETVERWKYRPRYGP